MNRLFGKLLFLWVGTFVKWLFYGFEKSIDELAKENNETLGMIVTLILGGLLYFYFF